MPSPNSDCRSSGKAGTKKLCLWLAGALPSPSRNPTSSSSIWPKPLSDKDRNADAIEVYEKMIQLETGRPLSFNNLGWLYQEDGRFDDARQKFEHALDLQPSFPLAHISIGGLEEELGNMEVAEACFRKALECNPGHAIALARLATLLRDRLSDLDLADVELRLNDLALDQTPRANLQFGLAHVLDARHRYDEAAQLLSEANAASQAVREKKQQRYQPADHERFVTNTIAAFAPEIFSRVAGAGLDTHRPVFVFGLPRSGTTLIEQVLASHSMIHGAGELTLGRKDFEAIPGLPGPQWRPADRLRGRSPARAGRSQAGP